MRAMFLNTFIVVASFVFPGCSCTTHETVVQEPPATTTVTKVETKPAPANTVVVQPAPAAAPAPATTVNVNH